MIPNCIFIKMNLGDKTDILWKYVSHHSSEQAVRVHKVRFTLPASGAVNRLNRPIRWIRKLSNDQNCPFMFDIAFSVHMAKKVLK